MVMIKISDILVVFLPNLVKSHKILRDLTRSSEILPNLVEISLDLADILPSLENLTGKCYISWSVWVS